MMAQKAPKTKAQEEKPQPASTQKPQLIPQVE